MKVLSFSTKTLPPKARKAAVEMAIAPHTDIQVDFSDDNPLSVSFKACILPGAEVLEGTSAAFSCRTTPSASSFILLVGRRGVHAVEHDDGTRIEIAPGAACLAPVEKTWTSITEQTSSFVSFALPHAVLDRAGIDIGRATHAAHLPSPVLPLLVGYAAALGGDAGGATAEEAALFGAHIQDLASLVLGARDGETRARARSRGLRAARIATIKADIRANLHSPQMSLEWLAGRHGMSPRAIRDMFYGEGTSFTDHLLGARLERASELLRNPAWDDQMITAIAYEAGFGDLSWFYQAFRRRYGMSPSDMRKFAHEAGQG